MIKKLVFIPILFLSMLGSPRYEIFPTARAFIVMDPWTGRVLYSRNPHKALAPASTIKIITALTALKKADLEKKISVSKFASSMEPSKVDIKEGETYYIKDLINAALLNSANDASVALAEGIAGSENDFVDMMNLLAEDLGARNTNFKTASGLPKKGQYTSAYDMALFVREAMKYKGFVDIMKKRKIDIFEATTGRQIKLRNHNKSLWWEESPYSLLVKTGYTKNARHCYAGLIEYNRWHKLIVVLLKSERPWHDLKMIAETGLRK